MTTLYLLHYNNYYNRIVKKEDTIAGYAPYVLGTLQNANFKPGDGITAEHIFNWTGDTPDYIIAEEDDGSFTRWFVVESERTRGGQYKISLYRDTLADYYDEVMDSTCLVEKGYVENNNPLIFNNETVGFNQIKRGETLMKNNLGSPWIVLYLSRYHTDDTGNYAYNEYQGEFIDEANQNTTDYVLDSLEDYKYYHYSNPAVDAGSGERYQYVPDLDIVFHSYVQKQKSSGSGYLWSHNDIESNGVKTSYGGSSSSVTYPIWTGNGWTPVGTMTLEESTAAWNRLMAYYRTGDSTDQYGLPINSYSDLGSQAGVDLLTAESGKTIKVGDKVYRIVVNTNSEYESSHFAYVNSSTTLGQNIVKECFTNFGVSTAGRTLNIGIEWGHYSYWTTIEFQETQLASNGIKYDIKYEGAVTTDSVYEIIATPYNNVTFTNGGAPFLHSGEIALQWFQDIINRYNGAGWAYDIQLVPYMPAEFDKTDITNLDKIYCYSGDALNRVNYSVGFRIPTASFSLNYDLTLPSINSNNKISNETQLYRICSPNGVGEYEFSPSKNGGFTGFEVDCTLLPFNPYIKVNPRYGWLYGADYNDWRGLILGGDFSLPVLNNNWSTYQLNNKNYQQIFDRNIESQEYNNKWNLANSIVGTVTGSAGGAAAGAMIGGRAVAAAGGAFSLVGGVADTVGNQMMFRENIDRQKDIFDMELGTIKARANTLTRGTSYNVNNKYFPYIEYFTCTDEELEAFQYKLEYTGMSVGVIGKTENYINQQKTSYFKGQLIEIDIMDDSHMAMEIAKNLQGGVRFYHA